MTVRIEIEDSEIWAAKRELSLHGIGLVLVANGLLLFFGWALCYRALGGAQSARPETLVSLAFDGCSMLGFAALGYLAVMDMETALYDGAQAARLLTMDWLWRALLPVVSYVACSLVALGLGLAEPRHAALIEGLLAAALVLYGLGLTQRHMTASFSTPRGNASP